MKKLMDAPEDGVKLQLFRGLAADLYNPQVLVLVLRHAGGASCSLSCVCCEGRGRVRGVETFFFCAVLEVGLAAACMCR